MGYRFRGTLWPGLREALQAARGHVAMAVFQWDDRGIFGRKRKEYVLTISWLTEQEARQHFKSVNRQAEYIAVPCMGEFPPSLRERLGSEESPRGWLVTWEEFLLLMAQYFPDATTGDWDLS